jgi:hypothetical protein
LQAETETSSLDQSKQTTPQQTKVRGSLTNSGQKPPSSPIAKLGSGGVDLDVTEG